MKRKSLVIFLILITCLGCGKINKKEINGTWKIIEYSANTPTISPNITNGSRTEALSSIYTFKNNHVFQLKSNFLLNGIVGNWEITKGSLLVMTYNFEGEKVKESYQLEQLKNNSMKWIQDLEELGTISMTLKKE